MVNDLSDALFSEQRHHMVETQLRARDIKDKRVLASVNTVPRHLFVPPTLQDRAYEDTPLTIGHSQTISQPYIVALMAEAARLKSTDVILEVGTGSGYAAAVFSPLVRQVYSLEIIPELSETAQIRLTQLGYKNITVVTGDGSVGLPKQAPFDAILVAATAPTIPNTLKQQLAIQGRLIIPVNRDHREVLIRVTRIDKDHYQEEVLSSVRFVPLRGAAGWFP